METTINAKSLERMAKALQRAAEPHVRLGILASGKRDQGKTSNATVGAAHEFGTSVLPKRSFLREPIIEHLDQRLYTKGEFDEEQLKRVIREQGIGTWLNRIAVLSEQIVQDAFDSAGFGKWKPSDMRNKENWQTLVETTQLRRSVTSEVKNG